MSAVCTCKIPGRRRNIPAKGGSEGAGGNGFVLPAGKHMKGLGFSDEIGFVLYFARARRGRLPRDADDEAPGFGIQMWQAAASAWNWVRFARGKCMMGLWLGNQNGFVQVYCRLTRAVGGRPMPALLLV